MSPVAKSRSTLLGAALAGCALVGLFAVSPAGSVGAGSPVAADVTTNQSGELPGVVAPDAVVPAAGEEDDPGGPPEGTGRPSWAGPKKGAAATGEDDAGPPPGRGKPSVEPVACEDARNHGQYVSSIARSTPAGPDREAIVAAAAESDCGKKPAPASSEGAADEG